MSSILAEQDISAHQSKLYSTSERVYITTLTMTLFRENRTEVDFPTSGLLFVFCQL
jgi:hypothetical protein